MQRVKYLADGREVEIGPEMGYCSDVLYEDCLAFPASDTSHHSLFGAILLPEKDDILNRAILPLETQP